ncbi:MAG TPA: hypothetical protein VM554_04285 [Acidisarcina sp.]|nr:hypothetical protein [Acidisarcina sp.]
MDWSVAAKIGAPEAGRAEHSRLASAAHQFEASMMSELMKPLQEDSLFAEKAQDAGADGGSGNALTGFASESLACALSQHGGLGIARQILDRLDVKPTKHAAPAAAGVSLRGV